jgi:hypothetical protein
MSRVLAGLIVLALAAAPAFAQDKPSPTAAKPKNEAKSTAQKKDESAAQQARAQDQGQAVNTRIDLTITDSRGDAAPITKSVSIMTADRAWGRIRTQGEIRGNGGMRYPVILNVDARPWMLHDNRARVEFTIEYRPADDVMVSNGRAVATPRSDPDSASPNINESLAVILEDGKPVVISQSADPVTDRKVKVEAKMTILR